MRFDRQTTEGRDLPALLGTATEEFRLSLERQTREVIDEAEARAAEIERHAAQNARQREREIEPRAQEAVQRVCSRASRVLDSIELVQTALGGMIAELRAELKGPEAQAQSPAGATRAAGAPPAAEPPPAVEAPAGPAAPLTSETQPARETEPARQAQPPGKGQLADDGLPSGEGRPPGEEPNAWDGQPATEAQRAEQERLAALIYPEPVNPQDQAASNPRTAEFDEMILAEIRRMFRDGGSREDVERFLGRFRLGDNYIGRLDEIYPQQHASAGWPGLIGRLRGRNR